jgi:phosphatidylethanolamine-binding protein (PEBP) family uncharacterized protein
LLCLAFITALAGCTSQGASLSPEGELEMSIQITSSAFNEGDKIPRIYTCDDKNISPPLEWTGIPSDTVSLALIMDDPDAPAGTWVHWVLYNLPPDLTELEQGKSGEVLMARMISIALDMAVRPPRVPIIVILLKHMPWIQSLI